MPSSKAARLPINKTASDELPISRARNSSAEEQRVRRITPDEDSPAAEEPSTGSRYPVTTRYVYGVSSPVVVCAVSHVCDVELQAGEKITVAPRIGDKARWGVDLVMSGEGSNATPHLTLMPLEAGAETSLVVITSKRTYHLFLRSGRQNSMLHTVFTYPEDLNARWNAMAPAAPTLQAVTPSTAASGK